MQNTKFSPSTDAHKDGLENLIPPPHNDLNPHKNSPLISVITATFNSQDTILDTSHSILIQSYPCIEHIIIDGGSTDNTLEILTSLQEQYTSRHILFKIISEKDEGIYDAMNKGLQHCSGEIVGFLNSDDYFTDKNTLSIIAKTFEENAVDCVFGDLRYIHPKSLKPIRKWKGSPYQKYSFLFGWQPAHPTFYIKKSMYDLYGNFSLKYKISSDYELALRLLKKHQIKSFYIPQNLADMRLGGVSNKSFSNIWRANLECFYAYKDNGFTPPPLPLFIALKLLRKILQYFKL